MSGTRVAIGDATAGMLLAQRLLDAHGEVLLAQGAALTEAVLASLRRRGIEFDGSWQANDALRFKLGYAYTDARFLQGLLAGSAFAIGTNLNVAGKYVPLVPRHKLNAGFTWDVTGSTQFSGGLTALSSQFMDNDEPNSLGVKIPAYSTVDLKPLRTPEQGIALLMQGGRVVRSRL